MTNTLQLKKKFLTNNQSKIKGRKNSYKGENNQELLKLIEKDFDECSNLCDQKLEISNECYYMIDANLKKINELLTIFEKDLKTQPSPNKNKKNTLLDDSKSSYSGKSIIMFN